MRGFLVSAGFLGALPTALLRKAWRVALGLAAASERGTASSSLLRTGT